MNNLQEARGQHIPKALEIGSKTPKPQLIINIERYQEAYLVWKRKEEERLKKLSNAENSSLPTEDFSQPIPKSEEVEKGEKLSNLSTEVKRAFFEAYVSGFRDSFNTILETITADSSLPTLERVFLASEVLKNALEKSNYRLAGLVLGKNPDILYLSDIEDALRKEVVTEFTKSVKENVINLRRIAYAQQQEELNPDDLLRLATSETSPINKDLKSQLVDIFYLIKGLRAQQLVNSLGRDRETVTHLTEEHITSLSQITGVSLSISSLQRAFNEYRKLLFNRGIVNSRFAPDLSTANFGEALAALSQTTQDPIQKRCLEALALGCAAGIDYIYGGDYGKAGDVLIALLLDRDNPEVSVLKKIAEYDEKSSSNDVDVLIKLISRIYHEVVSVNERGFTGLFWRQDKLANDFREKNKKPEPSSQ